MAKGIFRTKFEETIYFFPIYFAANNNLNMSKNNDWKERLNIVDSTNPDFDYQTDDAEEQETLPAEKQSLRIELDKRHRNGKTATLITGFIGSDDDLKELAKLLKTKCGVGGSARDGEILIQGDLRQKVKEILTKEGYTHTRII